MAGLDKPASEFSLREAVEWYKTLIRQVERLELGGLSAQEEQQINTSWMHLVNEVAEREGLPAGFLSYMLATLAQSEIQLADTAMQEAEGAGLI